MTTTYTARFAHSDADLPGEINLSATTEAEAIAEINEFVASGYRNGTWANVDFTGGRSYCAQNVHGKAVGARN